MRPGRRDVVTRSVAAAGQAVLPPRPLRGGLAALDRRGQPVAHRRHHTPLRCHVQKPVRSTWRNMARRAAAPLVAAAAAGMLRLGQARGRPPAAGERGAERGVRGGVCGQAVGRDDSERSTVRRLKRSAGPSSQQPACHYAQDKSQVRCSASRVDLFGPGAVIRSPGSTECVGYSSPALRSPSTKRTIDSGV